jgi:hypothetical protein
MSITVTDLALLTQLRQTADVVELLDPDGNVIGTFAAGESGQLPPGVESPFSESELAELRKQKSGRPLADILADLRKRR